LFKKSIQTTADPDEASCRSTYFKKIKYHSNYEQLARLADYVALNTAQDLPDLVLLELKI